MHQNCITAAVAAAASFPLPWSQAAFSAEETTTLKEIKQMTLRADTTTPDADFDLDVRLVEHADSGQLIYNTDDGCGSTCGACTTGAA